MNHTDFMLTEADYFLIDQYKDFLPRKVFDAHMHLPYNPSIPSLAGTSVYFREAYTPEDYTQDIGPLLPGVDKIGLNMIPMPAERTMRNRENGLRDMGNDHVFRMYDLHPEHVVTPMILPSDSEEFLFQLASRPGCRGLKCYAHVSGVDDLETAQIRQYLPESAWVVANERKLPIFLHLFRRAALSDPDNFRYITTMTHRYPNAQLVLCHCARGFASWTMMKAVKKLEDQGNIWFDLSAICESGTMAACILKNAGKRTMWGSDYPCSMLHGRSVSVGNWQSWLTGDKYEGPERALLPTENLIAFYQTALLLDLDQTQINDLFFNNAATLFGIL